MAKDMDSDVSDDDSDSPSIDKLLDLVHEHQKVIKKQSKKIKNLNALNDLNTSLATNYEDLLCKFKLLSKEHKELKLNLLCKEKEAQGRISLVLEQPSQCEIVFALTVPGEHKHYVEKSPYTQSNNWWTRNYTFASLCAVSTICSTNFLSTGFAA